MTNSTHDYADDPRNDTVLINVDGALVPRERELDRFGYVPPVIDTRDILSDPRGVRYALCVALDVPFSEKMLSWPAGSRATDGIWAPVWYDAVERSTSFGPPRSGTPAQILPEQLKPVLDAARPLYECLARHRLESVTR